MIKQRLDRTLYYFNFFYSYLNYRVFVGLFTSLMVGLLDGIGLALFIPLIQKVLAGSSQSQDRISQIIFERLNIEPDLSTLFTLIIILFSLKSLLKFLESYLRVVYQQFFMRKIRMENLDLLNDYDYQRFINSDSGRIHNSLSSEVARVSISYKQFFKSLQLGVLVFVYILLAMGSDWKFTLLILAGGFLMNYLFSLFYKRTKYFSKQFTAESHIFHGLLMQKINNFQYLKATGLNRIFSQKLKDKILDMDLYQRRLGIVESALGALREPFTIIIVFLAIYIYSYFFDEVIGGILLSLLLLYRGITYFLSMQEQWNLFLGVSGSLSNLESFREELYSYKEKSGEFRFDGLKNQLSLKNVSFSYFNKKNVLKNINLNINKNETIAIVGESGSGKTTLMNILAGILPVKEGNYLIDNKNIRNFEINSFKHDLGYIVQNPAVFNDTIFNNITFWKPKIEDNMKRFRLAIEKASLQDFIQELPKGEDTLLGLNGINISGGQKQRLAIARELFKEVDILFMDEATSNLDSETELEIHKNINELKGDYTILVIAHRLATVKSADRIILLKDGEIKGTGNYEELITSNNDFRRMVELQVL